MWARWEGMLEEGEGGDESGFVEKKTGRKKRKSDWQK